MDEFGLDRTELAGSLITMEFGSAGRIQQLWVSDPTLPDESEEFQFVCPPMAMGEEISEDYYPGTILLGVRMHPDDPWIVSRSSQALATEDDEEGPQAQFRYEFNFVDEIEAVGRFYEIPGPVPQISWDLEITNRSRRSVEIGELGFPLAFNTVQEGFPRSDDGVKQLCQDRVTIHKFIGGAASHLFVQRLNGRPPGLLVYPGDDTHWEFYHHVPASLSTPFRWEGIPVVYAHSRATIEREGWSEWFTGHTSVVLEPKETRRYVMRFASADRFRGDGVASTLAAVGRPAIRLFPSAVAPAEVGVAVEIMGTTPAQFSTDVEAELETDADEDGGFCFVKPAGIGPVKVSFQDVRGRDSELHLLFTLPIDELIQRRANWILNQQVVKEGPMTGAIVPAIFSEEGVRLDLDALHGPYGIEGSLADAVFLAEKNVRYPVVEQIQAIDGYLRKFLEERVLNPGDASLGAMLPTTHGVAVHAGNSGLYPMAFCLYDAMARIAEDFGGTERSSPDYRELALSVAAGMVAHTSTSEGNGIPLMGWVREAFESGAYDGLPGADRIRVLISRREREVGARKYPFCGDSTLSGEGFEEAHAVARARDDEDQAERVLRYAMVGRSLSPSWWWCGTDRRTSEEPDAPAHPAMADRGELSISPTSVANSLIVIRALDRDVTSLDENRLRMAFSGLLSVWALVREDGSANAGFCPDAASRQFGMSWTSGDVGVGLTHYLRGISSYVLPSRSTGVQTFGCYLEAEADGDREWYTVRPWDGVGRRIVVRQLGLEVNLEGASLVEVKFDGRKRSGAITLVNRSDRERTARLRVRGMWGRRIRVGDTELVSEKGTVSAIMRLGPQETLKLNVEVVG